MVKGEGRRVVEYVTTDDRSEIETAVRFYEKLMTEDKVDLILPPWGTAMNFAVAPVANKNGYPMNGPTVSSNKREGAVPAVLLRDPAAAGLDHGRAGRDAQGGSQPGEDLEDRSRVRQRPLRDRDERERGKRVQGGRARGRGR
jgi:hypothetical protein